LPNQIILPTNRNLTGAVGVAEVAVVTVVAKAVAAVAVEQGKPPISVARRAVVVTV
jgi:hypothetical protein